MQNLKRRGRKRKERKKEEREEERKKKVGIFLNYLPELGQLQSPPSKN